MTAPSRDSPRSRCPAGWFRTRLSPPARSSTMRNLPRLSTIAATVTSMPRVIGLLYLKLPDFGFGFTGVPQRLELAEIHASHGRLEGIRHAFPALGASAIDEGLLVGDEERFRVPAELGQHAPKLDVAVQAP